MSSLSEQERIGLEEVFLSISSPRNFGQKWLNLKQNFSLDLNLKKAVSPLSIARVSQKWLKNGLKNHKITKLFTKTEKRRKI
jgi:hypothetical protein